MKILIVGPLKDFSGYAHLARNMASALHMNKVDVAMRHVKYDDYEYIPSVEELDMFKKPMDECDIVWQWTTPNEIRYIPGKMNIATLFWETTRIPRYWVEQLNLMDLIIVPCNFNATVLSRCGVTKPICTANPLFDISIYNQQYDRFEIPNAGDRTIYYNICQFNAKKGLDALLRSYFRAFYDIPEETLLVLKTYISMVNRNGEIDRVRGFIDNVKKRMRLPQYPPVYVITNILDDKGVYRLHTTGDVYVCPSRGEGWGIPPFEAMAMGSHLITNNWGGLGEFVHENNAILYPGAQSIVFDQPHPDPNLYTSAEEWFEPNDFHMSVAMRNVHECIRGRGQKDFVDKLNGLKTRAKADIQNYDFRTAGPKFIAELRKLYSSWKQNGCIEVEQNEANKV